jgi:hypothetical protein
MDSNGPSLIIIVIIKKKTKTSFKRTLAKNGK